MASLAMHSNEFRGRLDFDPGAGEAYLPLRSISMPSGWRRGDMVIVRVQVFDTGFNQTRSSLACAQDGRNEMNRTTWTVKYLEDGEERTKNVVAYSAAQAMFIVGDKLGVDVVTAFRAYDQDSFSEFD